MKNRFTIMILALGIWAMLLGCTQAGLKEGGLYYMKNEKGSYSVLKVLKLDDRGVHVRLYSNEYISAPTGVDEKTLVMSGVERKPNETLGMGHVALSKKSFDDWKATFFQQSTVTEEELEGYKLWLDAKGGYF